MDKVAELQETEIPLIAFPTIGYFIPLLEEKRAEISSVPKRTFKYGGTDRHKLDIYYPSEAPSSGRTPILFFVYGGGFEKGDRTLPPPVDLAYANVAAYFAQRGFITVIPDYRLVPPAVFPDGARDVRDAMEWVVANPHSLASKGVTDPATDSIFVMGHSAGASHVFTALSLPELYSESLHPRIKGAILFSGGYHFHPKGAETGYDEVVKKYWGSLETAVEEAPHGLLKNLPEDRLPLLPEILLVESERDPLWLKIVGEDFREALEIRLGREAKKIIAKVHNHISVTFTLGTGRGEEWAEDVIAWIKSTSAGNN